MLILFDDLGTLFSLDKVRKRFIVAGIEEALADYWIMKLGQAMMASSLAGKYIPFRDLAYSTLKHLFAAENISERYVDDTLDSLEEIEPFDDAAECLRSLRSDGHRLAVLTNFAYDDAERLLRRSGLKKEFHRIYSADDAKACKPNPSIHQIVFRTMFTAPYDCCVVSAHDWEIMGAEAAGMNGVYVNRIEGLFPFPERPSLIVPCLRDVPGLISKEFGKPAVADETGFEGERIKRYGRA